MQWDRPEGCVPDCSYIFMSVLKAIFYNVDMEISNNPKICKILAYFFHLGSRQEFSGYLKLHINLIKNDL